MRDEHLRAFLSAARAHVHVDTRRRRRWLRRQLEEDRTFEDACRATVSAGARVRLAVSSGRTYNGSIVAVSGDVVAVAGDTAVVYVALWATVGFETLAGPAATDATVLPASTIEDAVLGLGLERGTILVGTRDGAMHRGRVAGVGRDLLWLDGGRHLRLGAVTEVTAGR